ncbi:MAG TPA: dihydroneopterin aldolase [Gemmatimonadaceae bacterium]|jgi:dihydroneopterin aldolase
MTTEITLKSMRFHTRVGILASERSTPQPVEIDLTVAVRDGDSVLDYRDLYELVASTLLAGHIDFLEEIGDRIARGAIERSDRVSSVRVAVRKPHVALGGPLDYAEVVVRRDAGV